jgi:hypothetical protein
MSLQDPKTGIRASGGFKRLLLDQSAFFFSLIALERGCR